MIRAARSGCALCARSAGNASGKPSSTTNDTAYGAAQQRNNAAGSGKEGVMVCLVECVWCGQPRSVYIDRPYRLERARNRPCKACWLRRITIHQVALSTEEPDHAAVQRLLNGAPVKAGVADMQAAVKYLDSHGMSARQIAERLRVSERTVVRMRARNRAAA